jgi:hypothetical protein
MNSGTAHHLARPEGDAPPSLMLEYQKSRRRRITLGQGRRETSTLTSQW